MTVPIREAVLAEALAAKRSSGAVSGLRATAEDGSATVGLLHVALMGADPTHGQFIPALAALGKFEGFNLMVRTSASPDGAREMEQSYRQAKMDNIALASVPVDGSLDGNDYWSEDQGEVAADGTFCVPALSDVALSRVDGDLSQDRLRRYYPEVTADWAGLSKEERARFQDVHAFPRVGAVLSRKSQLTYASLAAALGRELRVNGSHLEGGNLLVGTLASGEPYALIGKDSWAQCRSVLEHARGGAVPDDQLRAIIAEDLGVAANQVHVVEQPGEFHLDMAISLLAPGVVALNDARAAATLQARWLQDDARRDPLGDPKAVARKVRELTAAAERKARFEDLAAADLASAGLTVHRMAGVFADPEDPGRPLMNFLNAEHWKAGTGEELYIALGGDVRAERYVAQKLLGELPTGIARVHFLERALTGPTLRAQGGISCRVKAEGTPAPGGPPLSMGARGDSWLRPCDH